MKHSNRLGNLIFSHWQSHQPEMVAKLTRLNMLEQAVQQAEERAADLLFQLLAVEKMQYQEAWEQTMRECLPPEESKSSTSNPKSDRLAIFE